MNTWLKSKKGCQKLSIDNRFNILKAQKLFTPRCSMLHKIIGQKRIKVHGGAFRFVNSMRAIGIRHHLELLIVFYKFKNQRLGILVMNIVISGTMNQQ
jgi:hypothetical protein